MNIKTFKKLKVGDKLHYDAMGVGYNPYTVTKVEDNKVYVKPLYYDIEMIIEEGEQSFFSLIISK